MMQGKMIAPIIDPEQMLQVTNGDMELLQEIIDVFLEDIPEQLGHLEQAITQSHADLVKRNAHSIKGAAANMGFAQVREIARELEATALDSDEATWRSWLDVLREVLNRLESELEQYDWEAAFSRISS